MSKKSSRNNDKSNWTLFLEGVSVISFIGIFLNDAFGLSLENVAGGMLFTILGIALLATGGALKFFEYFKDGLTNDEIGKIVTVLIGVASIAAGVSAIVGIEGLIFVSIRAVVSLLAALIIVSNSFVRRSVK